MAKSPERSKKSNSSSKNSNDSKKSSKSPKSPKQVEKIEEPEIVVPVPDGIMHKRMRFLLESTLKNDVEFIVGPEGGETSIKAHKCILSAESPIFEKLFADCQEWKDVQLRKHEQEALEIRQREAEMERELAKKAEPRNKEDTSERSRSRSKGEEGKKKSSKDREGSPSSKRDGSNESKSPKKSNKSNKSDKSDKSDKSGSKSGGKESSSKNKNKNTEESQPITNVNFYQDEVIGPDQIRVRDVHSRGFFQLLRYIYYDEMGFQGVTNTIHTLYAARKYCFYDLARACVNYLENNVCAEHIFSILQTAINFHEDRLLNLCMRLIINNTSEVINREDFKNVKKEIVVMILEQDVLNTKEIELFDRVMKWAASDCDRLKISAVPLNQRFALGDHNFALIRFPAMDGKEFATQVLDSGVLRKDEIIPILKYFITGDKPNLPYPCQPRRQPCLAIDPLDTASVASSEITFIGEWRLHRFNSFGHIAVQSDERPADKRGFLGECKRSCSPPPRFNVDEDEFEKIVKNLRQLKRLAIDEAHFQWNKMHKANMNAHYR